MLMAGHMQETLGQRYGAGLLLAAFVMERFRETANLVTVGSPEVVSHLYQDKLRLRRNANLLIDRALRMRKGVNQIIEKSGVEAFRNLREQEASGKCALEITR